MEQFAPHMPSLLALVAPIALALPLGALGVSTAGDWRDAEPVAQAREGNRSLAPMPLSADAPGWAPLFEGIEPADPNQVRIERRVILRISPARNTPRQGLVSQESAVPQQRARLVERSFGKCIDSDRIGAVADRGDKLLMYLRDRRMLTAQLEKGCSPRDFYQGFYMERSDDGKLCIKRDRIISRSGARCQVTKLRELVAEREG